MNQLMALDQNGVLKPPFLPGINANNESLRRTTGIELKTGIVLKMEPLLFAADPLYGDPNGKPVTFEGQRQMHLQQGNELALWVTNLPATDLRKWLLLRT